MGERNAIADGLVALQQDGRLYTAMDAAIRDYARMRDDARACANP